MEPFHPIYEYLITHSNSIVKENHQEISKYFVIDFMESILEFGMANQFNIYESMSSSRMPHGTTLSSGQFGTSVQ